MLSGLINFIKSTFGAMFDLFDCFSIEFKALVVALLIFLVMLAVKRIIF